MITSSLALFEPFLIKRLHKNLMLNHQIRPKKSKISCICCTEKTLALAQNQIFIFQISNDWTNVIHSKIYIIKIVFLFDL